MLLTWLLLRLVLVVGQNCTQDLAKVIRNLPSVFPQDDYSTMAVATGKCANDLGDYSLCVNVPEAQYALFAVYRPGTWIMSTSVSIGLCGPKTCSKADYFDILSQQQANPSFSHFFDRVHEMELAQFHTKGQINSDEIPADLSIRIEFPGIDDKNNNSHGRNWITLTISVVLLLLVGLGTALDINNSTGERRKLTHVALEEEKQPKPEEIEPQSVKLLKCFSLYSNIPKLFTLKNSTNRDPLDIFHAIRVLSILWIIYGHVCEFRLKVNPLKNYYEIYDKMKDSRYAFVYGAEFAVDTFFWMSGHLLTFLFLQNLQTHETLRPIEWLWLYLHRLYRIVPSYLYILLLMWTAIKYLGSGPLWFQQSDLDIDCEKYWWTNMLFINNFLPNGDGNLCLPQSWYLANDMQFFILTPPLLYVYHKWKRWVGWALLIGLTAVSVGVSLYIADLYAYKVVAIAPENASFYYNFYMKPYTRFPPYALGILSGILLHSSRLWKQSSTIYDKFAVSLVQVIDISWVRYACYALGLFLLNFFIFAQYDAYRDVDSGWSSWSPASNVMFIGLNHIGFALGLVLLFQPILHGFAPVMQWLLGHPIWSPLARLTFCVYLVHLHLILAYFLNSKTAYWVDDLNVSIDVIFSIVMSYTAAIGLTLLVESPFLALEKCLRRGVKGKAG